MTNDNLLPQITNKTLLVPAFEEMNLHFEMLSLLRHLYDGPIKVVTGLEADAIEAPSKTLQNGKTRFIEKANNGQEENRT